MTHDRQAEMLARALERLEAANDALCAARTQEQYDAMISAGQGPLLERLDEARRQAREALSAWNARAEGVGVEEIARDVAETVCRDVAELPDRSSPDDWPEAMLVTGEELSLIVTREIAAALQQGTSHEG